jgi:ferredoxin-nitrate reductase
MMAALRPSGSCVPTRLTSLPNVRLAEEALKKAKFVVVQEISNKPETLAYADVILPAAAWAEKEGTMTNSERRISYLAKYWIRRAKPCPIAKSFAALLKKWGIKASILKTPQKFMPSMLNLPAKPISISADLAMISSSNNDRYNGPIKNAMQL